MLNGNVTNVFGGLGVMRGHVRVQLIAANKLHTQNKKKHMNFYARNTSKDKQQSNRKKEELA
jgi:hypothetical protein